MEHAGMKEKEKEEYENVGERVRRERGDEARSLIARGEIVTMYGAV